MRRRAHDRRGRDHPVGNEGSASQGMRAATRPSDDKESPEAKRIGDRDDIRRAVGHRAPLVAVRLEISRARVAHMAHAPLGALLHGLGEKPPVIGSATVRNDRRAVPRSDDRHLQPATVCSRHRLAQLVHPLER